MALSGPLVIAYRLEGERPGYAFTTPTTGYDDAVIRAVWRYAMPRGQGWGAEDYAGAHALKAFPLPDGRFAVSDTVVTDQQDERGRRGIRRAEITLVDGLDYDTHLRRLLDRYEPRVLQRAEDRLTVCKKTNIIGKTLPRFSRKDPQLVLTRKYKGVADWQVMEAFMLKLALDPVMPMRRWGPVLSFTTLALDYHDESQMVVLPADRAASLDVPAVSLR